MPDTLLHVERLKKVYESPTGDVEAIGDISFRMSAGELVCIVGPSGCGKTTLLKCIAGLLAPTSGTVELDGSRGGRQQPGDALEQRRLAAARRTHDAHQLARAHAEADVADGLDVSGGRLVDLLQSLDVQQRVRHAPPP